MNTAALVECVPNFSEGRRKDVIDAISKAISETKGCHLLDVDPGQSTNRTVITFVGEPDKVLAGALAGARVAYNLIDMREQKGEHPRIGALDVCPFIPIKNITMNECIDLSKRFAKLLSDELDIPVFLYGESQSVTYRKELSSIRSGEYEGLREKFKDPNFTPDFGPTVLRPKWGASCVGARSFLIAYNVNLLGTKEQAHRIALNIREQGRSENEPGKLKKVKAIGWWLDEESLAQISINLVDFKTSNLHHAYLECVNDAKEMNVSTCGSQLVGLVPLEAILIAADYFIKTEKLLILEESQKVKLVVQRLGLNSLSIFNPKERIIEYLIQDRLEKDVNIYQTMSVKSFINAIQARTAIPGGGCVSASIASMGSALACMSAQLTYGNRKFEKYDSQIRQLLPEFYDKCQELSQLIDEDALAFNSYVDARRMPGKTETEKLQKEEMISKGLFNCIEVPFKVISKAYSLWPYMKELATIFNIETKSDLLVAVKCLETGIYGAYANVLINLKSFNNNNEAVNKIASESEAMWLETKQNTQDLISLIESRIQ